MERRKVRSKAATERARELRRDATKTERRLWPHLRGERLGVAFRRQHPVGPFYADYCCLSLKLVIEVDGPWHDRVADAERDAYMQALGFTVLRFPAQQVSEEIEGVVAHIEHEIWLLENGRG